MAKIRFWVDFDQETDGEYSEVVHFHFENCCPACGYWRAGTDQHQSVLDCVDDNDGRFRCEECDSQFRILQYEYIADTPAEALIELEQKGFGRSI